MIMIDDTQLDIFDLIIRCPWQNKQLHNRHHKYDPDDGRVPEYLAKLFLQ
jgi:hypothetical protein